MEDSAIFEIGNIIHVRHNLFGDKLNEQKIIDSYEYKIFKSQYPILCRLAEEYNG